jgi:hypothetical protein
MKKFKLIFTLLAIVLLVPSCEKDGGDSKLNLTEGAIANVQKVATTDGFIDLVAINAGSSINIGYTIDEARGKVVSMDVVAFYKKISGEVYKGVLETNVTTFPSTFSITQDDLFAAFEQLNVAGDFEVGDQLTITTELTLENGTVIKTLTDSGRPNYGGNVGNTASFTPLQVYNVACPSDLAGTYSVLTTGASTDTGPTPAENPITNFPYNVTITDEGGGSYSISDAFGGVYILWYDIYGLDFEVEGTFSDVCGVISGTFPEPFGTDVEYDGTVNANGTLTIHWINGYGDEGVSTFTRN